MLCSSLPPSANFLFDIFPHPPPLPHPPPYLLSAPAAGRSARQVANQSAVSQEQVDSILQENDALRTNLAALEQVTENQTGGTLQFSCSSAAVLGCALKEFHTV